MHPQIALLFYLALAVRRLLFKANYEIWVADVVLTFMILQVGVPEGLRALLYPLLAFINKTTETRNFILAQNDEYLICFDKITLFVSQSSHRM